MIKKSFFKKLRTKCQFQHILFMFLTLMIFAGCVSHRDIEYLQSSDKKQLSYNEAQPPDYRLKPFDELYIQINSLDDVSANVFSSSGSQQSSAIAAMQPYGASLASYGIDKYGYIQLPVIGKINVENKTIPEVSEMLKDSLSNILSQPIVIVKLVNRYITVLGEVRNPGHYAYSQEKLTIYDAIGMAGDITDFGNRREVILARNESGKNHQIFLNLSKSSVLASEYYYLRPNDLIYIKPMRKRYWGMKEFPFTIILSTISTALLIYTVVK